MTAFLIDAADLRLCTVFDYMGLDSWTGIVAAAQLIDPRGVVQCGRDMDELRLVARPVYGSSPAADITVNRHLFEQIAERQSPRIVNLVAAVATGVAAQG